MDSDTGTGHQRGHQQVITGTAASWEMKVKAAHRNTHRSWEMKVKAVFYNNVH